MKDETNDIYKSLIIITIIIIIIFLDKRVVSEQDKPILYIYSEWLKKCINLTAKSSNFKDGEFVVMWEKILFDGEQGQSVAFTEMWTEQVYRVIDTV